MRSAKAEVWDLCSVTGIVKLTGSRVHGEIRTRSPPMWATCRWGGFVRSFVLRGGVRPLADFRRAFSLLPALRPMRPRLMVKPSLGLAQCASPLTLGLVLYIYGAQLSRWVSLAGANMRSSYIRPLALAICCPHRRLSPHLDAPNLDVMACHSLKRTQANPLYLPENLIS